MNEEFEIEVNNNENINDIEILDNTEDIEINAAETEQEIDVDFINDDEIEIEIENNTEEFEIDFSENAGSGTEEIDPTVPEHVKQITKEDINNWNNKSDFSGKYEDLENKPEIPEQVKFNRDFNLIEENGEAKAFTFTGYIVDDKYINNF